MSSHTSHKRLTRYAAGGLLLLAAGLSGCAHVSYELHHAARGMQELVGNHDWPYYHSGKTGEIVPRHGAAGCGPCAEPAFFGYEATCWHPWPAGWIGCPTFAEELDSPPTDAWNEPPPPESSRRPEFPPVQYSQWPGEQGMAVEPPGALLETPPGAAGPRLAALPAVNPKLHRLPVVDDRPGPPAEDFTR